MVENMSSKSLCFLITFFLISTLLIGGVIAPPLPELTPWDFVPKSPVVADGTVYSIGYNQNYEVFALDAATGCNIWNFTIGNQSTFYYPPAIGNKIAYVVGPENRIFALDETNGDQVWNYTADLPLVSSPVVINGIVYGESRFSRVYALNAKTGDLIWKRSIGNETTVNVPGIMPAPLINEGRIYVEGFDYNYEIYALDAINGTKIWNFSSDGSEGSEDPVYFISISNDILLASRFNDMIAINATNGLLIWNYTKLRNLYHPPSKGYADLYTVGYDRDHYVVSAIDAATSKQGWKFTPEKRNRWVNSWFSSLIFSNGTLYFGTEGNGIYALNAFSGKPKWNYVTVNRVYHSPIISGEVVYAGDDSGIVYAINAVTGEKIWDHPIDSSLGSAPVISHGIVFAERYDNSIFALNASTGNEMWNYKIGDAPICSVTNRTQSRITSTTENPELTALDSVTTTPKSSLSIFLPIFGLIGVICVVVKILH